jgi:hypothetical protein
LLGVSYHVTTALGRDVPLGDWEELHGDTILKVLHDHRTSPFNPTNHPLALAALTSVTGLSPADTAALCDALVARALVEAVRPGGPYRITGQGVAVVRNAPGSR